MTRAEEYHIRCQCVSILGPFRYRDILDKQCRLNSKSRSVPVDYGFTKRLVEESLRRVCGVK